MTTLPITGIHHITALASSARANAAFYTRVLGLRLIKKTVNFDAPEVYHLYYGDGLAQPGTVLTFFPYEGIVRGRRGVGQVISTRFAIAPVAISFWRERLGTLEITFNETQTAFGETALRFEDPDGMMVEIVTADGDTRPGYASEGLVAEMSVKGFHSALIQAKSSELTGKTLISTLGYRLLDKKNNLTRYTVGQGGSGTYVDILETPDVKFGHQGGGSVHHIAFRTPTDADQETIRQNIEQNGLSVTPMQDRQYFHSIYYREPGGVLFEVATDTPGFEIDEPLETLGEKLMLPPWYEKHRAKLEEVLPALS